jgi:UTP:GlnB (protein PII) uridylyltransferase
MAQTLDNEPDVKQGPGGLRDLQRVLSVNAIASGRPAVLAEPALIEAPCTENLIRVDAVMESPKLAE